MSDDLDDCEERVVWIDIPPKRVIRIRARVRRVGRACVACGRIVQEREFPPYSDHAADCALVAQWGRIIQVAERAR